jgi:hypothetical protein
MVQFPHDVQTALDAGELWRAKQLVGGRISSSNRYDTDLYEQYGVILMRMGDLVLAGKYLFLSGRRSPEYAAAIALYVRQHGRGGWRTMVGTFPNAVRKIPVDELPQPLRDDFGDFQAPVNGSGIVDVTPQKRSPWRERLGCLAAGVLFISLAVSISELIHTVWHGILSLFK